MGTLLNWHISTGILTRIARAIIVKIRCWNVSIHWDSKDSLKSVVYAAEFFSVQLRFMLPETLSIKTSRLEERGLIEDLLKPLGIIHCSDVQEVCLKGSLNLLQYQGFVWRDPLICSNTRGLFERWWGAFNFSPMIPRSARIYRCRNSTPELRFFPLRQKFCTVFFVPSKLQSLTSPSDDNLFNAILLRILRTILVKKKPREHCYIKLNNILPRR